MKKHMKKIVSVVLAMILAVGMYPGIRVQADEAAEGAEIETRYQEAIAARKAILDAYTELVTRYTGVSEAYDALTEEEQADKCFETDIEESYRADTECDSACCRECTFEYKY